MGLLRLATRSSGPPTAILIRLLVAADLALDGARAADWHWLIGDSRLERLTLLPSPIIHIAGYLQLLLAMLILLGWFTRAAALVPLVLPLLMASAAWLRVESLQAASMLDATVHHGGVVAASLFLVIRGAGSLSIDHLLHAGRRRFR